MPPCGERARDLRIHESFTRNRLFDPGVPSFPNPRGKWHGEHRFGPRSKRSRVFDHPNILPRGKEPIEGSGTEVPVGERRMGNWHLALVCEGSAATGGAMDRKIGHLGSVFQLNSRGRLQSDALRPVRHRPMIGRSVSGNVISRLQPAPDRPQGPTIHGCLPRLPKI